MRSSLTLPCATKVTADARGFALGDGVKAKLRLPDDTGYVQVLRVGDDVITWDKRDLVGRGGYAACYIGMRSRLCADTRKNPLERPGFSNTTGCLPCIVRSRIYIPDTDLDHLSIDESLETGMVKAMAEGAAAREDAIGERVSPALYAQGVGVSVARKPDRGGRRALTVGALCTGDFQHLFDAAQRQGLAPSDVVVRFLSEITPKLADMHQRFIHNDIKAANFLFTWNGERIVFDIGDFGYANVLPGGPAELMTWQVPCREGEDFAQRNALNGAEESLTGVADDPGSDIFSLGVMCLKLITGEHPFEFMRRQACTLGIEDRLDVFEAFEACRPKHGKALESDGSLLQERFHQMWHEVRDACPPYLMELISAMVARTHQTRLTADGCIAVPSGQRRPDARAIHARLKQHPRDEDACKALDNVAAEIAAETGKANQRRRALSHARTQHGRVMAMLEEPAHATHTA